MSSDKTQQSATVQKIALDTRSKIKLQDIRLIILIAQKD